MTLKVAYEWKICQKQGVVLFMKCGRSKCGWMEEVQYSPELRQEGCQEDAGVEFPGVSYIASRSFLLHYELPNSTVTAS